MLIHTPNHIPKSFQEKFRCYIPRATFRKDDDMSPLSREIPVISIQGREKSVHYEEEYSSRSILRIFYHFKRYEVERHGSGYVGDYTDYVREDGVRILFSCGSPKMAIDLTKNKKYSYYKARSELDIGSSSPGDNKNGCLRDDLDDPKVQAFIMEMLEDHWHTLLQLPLEKGKGS